MSSACRSLPRAASAARLVALAAALALACGRQSVYEVHGIVREVDAAAKQATIEHEDIPGLMSAMTMGFDVPDPAVLAKLVPGERVVFELEVTEQELPDRRACATDEAGRAPAPRAAPSSASVARSGDLAPDFALTDQNGARVSRADLRGRWALVDFVYTRCTGPCPILTSLQVDAAAEARARAAASRCTSCRSRSIPSSTRPRCSREYARARGADLANWSFLTGPPAEVADVVKRFGVGTLRAADGQIDHVVATFLVDPQGRIVQRWLGLENGAEERRAEIAALAAPRRRPAREGLPAGVRPDGALARRRGVLLRARRLAGAPPPVAHRGPRREERAHRPGAGLARRRRARARGQRVPAHRRARPLRAGRHHPGRPRRARPRPRRARADAAPARRLAPTTRRACSSIAASSRARRSSASCRPTSGVERAGRGARPRARSSPFPTSSTARARSARRTSRSGTRTGPSGSQALLNQLPYPLLPVMLQSIESEPGGLPIGEPAKPVSPVDHRAYALTWFVDRRAVAVGVDRVRAPARARARAA